MAFHQTWPPWRCPVRTVGQTLWGSQRLQLGAAKLVHVRWQLAVTHSLGWHLSAERLQTIHALGILKWLGNTAYAPKCCISAEWSRKTLVTSDKLCFSKINLYSSHTGKKLTPPPGNQTQVTRMAIMHDITKPVMQICWVKLKIIVLLCNNQKTIKFHHTHIGSIFAAPLITVLHS